MSSIGSSCCPGTGCDSEVSWSLLCALQCGTQTVATAGVGDQDEQLALPFLWEPGSSMTQCPEVTFAAFLRILSPLEVKGTPRRLLEMPGTKEKNILCPSETYSGGNM